MHKIVHAASSIPLLEYPSQRMTKEGGPFDTQMEEAWRANSSKRSEWSSRKSANPVCWSHKHSSLVTSKELHTLPGFQTSIDAILKGASGSKMPSYVDFSENVTLASGQCAHDRVHFLTSSEIPGHQNRDTVLY